MKKPTPAKMGRTIVVAACLLWVAVVVACNRDCPACPACDGPAASTASTTAPPPLPDFGAPMRDACDDIRIAHGKGGPLAGEPIDALNQKLCAPYWGQ